MRKLIFVTTAIVMLTAITAAGQNADKKDTKKQTQKSKVDSVDRLGNNVDKDYQAFKKDADKQLKKIEKNLNDLNAKIAKLDDKSKQEYRKQIRELQAKSKSLRTKINDKENERKLETTKEEFQRDMKNLESAINDFFEDNKK
jgi:TolA-binding protein